jgi:hypothetical protein
LQSLAFGILNVREPNLFGVAIQQSHYDSLPRSASAGDLGLFVFVHVAGKATYKSFVGFNLPATQFTAIFMHCEPDAVEYEPCSFLSDADGTVNLPRANAILAIGDKPHSGQPLVQAERRILKDSASLDGELPHGVAFITLPAIVLFLKSHVVATAAWANNTIAPTASNNVLAAIDRVRKENNCVFKSRGFHKSKYAGIAWSCQVYSCPYFGAPGRVINVII